jgi:hypothetical protein
VDAQTPLSDLLSHVGQAPCAVPVVDEEQQYVGIISKRMLLQALDREGQTMADQSTRGAAPGNRQRRAICRCLGWPSPAPTDGGGADWLTAPRAAAGTFQYHGSVP